MSNFDTFSKHQNHEKSIERCLAITYLLVLEKLLLVKLFQMFKIMSRFLILVLFSKMKPLASEYVKIYLKTFENLSKARKLLFLNIQLRRTSLIPFGPLKRVQLNGIWPKKISNISWRNLSLKWQNCFKNIITYKYNNGGEKRCAGLRLNNFQYFF